MSEPLPPPTPAPGEASEGTLPLDAVRDLLGLVRAVYAAARARGAARVELTRVARVGQRLSQVLELSRSPQRGSAAAAEAWARLDEALADAGGLVDPLAPAAPLVQAARCRVAAPATPARRKSTPR
ncbi:hypothetical protein [Chondromyces crocatus]|uniref:hypothetical protein n=1 Tax=Chondromyces crocatus TaxID=52 RepID=UPI001FE05932|nr:hypothetical protein [Chondromyces crocatus]